MHTIIIFQQDANVSNLLHNHSVDLQGNITTMQGFEVMASQITQIPSLKGVAYLHAGHIFSAIKKFCKHLLETVQNDAVEMQVIFIYHQTKADVVRTIKEACNLFQWSGELQNLADAANKHLIVKKVHLLSCESGIDKLVQPPYRAGIKPSIDQAIMMRDAAAEGFKTKQAPPHPSQNFYTPTVVTYSTGDADRGGVKLDPFHVAFRDLDGRFDQNGDWRWNDPNNIDPDGEPDSGTIFEDNETSGSTKKELSAQSEENIMGFHPH